MKFFLLPILAVWLVPGVAVAQVSVNANALTQLSGVSAAPSSAVHKTMSSVRTTPQARHPRHVEAKKPATPAAARATPPAPKPPASVATPVTIATHVPVATSAPIAAPAPITIAFAADSATLPADARTRLAPFCKIPGPIVIDARAPADPGNNSHSMRLSLARALAVRASLNACGVASQNIFPRALGAAPGGATDNTEIQAGLNP